jgi:uncharacterized membrane protein
MHKGIIAALVVVLLQFIIGIYFYPQMPEQIAIHWNIEGLADGFSSKFWGLFLIPLISIAFLLLFFVIPRIDPLNNIEEFSGYYWGFGTLFLGYMLFVDVITIFWNLGVTFNLFQALSPAFGVLFFSIGILVGKAKRNWFVGIRTPWTLSNQTVWDQTHELGSKIFKIAGVICVFGFFFSGWIALTLIMAPIIVGSIFLIVYSYVEYQKTLKNYKSPRGKPI